MGGTKRNLNQIGPHYSQEFALRINNPPISGLSEVPPISALRICSLRKRRPLRPCLLWVWLHRRLKSPTLFQWFRPCRALCLTHMVHDCERLQLARCLEAVSVLLTLRSTRSPLRGDRAYLVRGCTA